jgi:hypothetical protein
MTSSELMDEFRKLTEDEQNEFLAVLVLWTHIKLPDGKFLVLPMSEVRRDLNEATGT